MVSGVFAGPLIPTTLIVNATQKLETRTCTWLCDAGAGG